MLSARARAWSRDRSSRSAARFDNKPGTAKIRLASSCSYSCSEPGFWDLGGFYKPLSTAKDDALKWAGGAAVAGAAIGAASAAIARNKRNKVLKEGK